MKYCSNVDFYTQFYLFFSLFTLQIEAYNLFINYQLSFGLIFHNHYVQENPIDMFFRLMTYLSYNYIEHNGKYSLYGFSIVHNA